MQKVAKFEKVSFENFAAAYLMFKGPTNIEIIKMVLKELKIVDYNISYTNSRIHDDTRYSLNCD